MAIGLSCHASSLGGMEASLSDQFDDLRKELETARSEWASASQESAARAAVSDAARREVRTAYEEFLRQELAPAVIEWARTVSEIIAPEKVWLRAGTSLWSGKGKYTPADVWKIGHRTRQETRWDHDVTVTDDLWVTARGQAVVENGFLPGQGRIGVALEESAGTRILAEALLPSSEYPGDAVNREAWQAALSDVLQRTAKDLAGTNRYRRP